MDFADALPESPIDANYAGDGRFEVLLFEDEDSAANQVESVLPLAGSKNGNFERHKNVPLAEDEARSSHAARRDP